MTEALVSVAGVGLQAGHTVVLRGVTLRVTAGEAVGISGPNGAGKTTLLRLIATLARPTEGAGRVLGATLGTPEVYRVRPRLGLVGHLPALYPELTLRENLHLVARLVGRPVAEAEHALEAVGLAGAGDRRADHSSNGMQRRVDLARLLVTRPDLLLLDEAHAGLDSSAQGMIGALVTEVVGRGGGALLVSHDPDRIVGSVHRVLHLENGTLSGAPA